MKDEDIDQHHAATYHEAVQAVMPFYPGAGSMKRLMSGGPRRLELLSTSFFPARRSCAVCVGNGDLRLEPSRQRQLLKSKPTLKSGRRISPVFGEAIPELRRLKPKRARVFRVLGA